MPYYFNKEVFSKERKTRIYAMDLKLLKIQLRSKILAYNEDNCQLKCYQTQEFETVIL